MPNLGPGPESESSFTTTSSTGRLWSGWISAGAKDWPDKALDSAEWNAWFAERQERGEPVTRLGARPALRPPPKPRDAKSSYPNLTAREAITEANLAMAVENLREDREAARPRVHAGWWLMVGFAVVGALVVVLGATLVLLGVVQLKVATTLPLIISGGGGFGMFWRIYRGEQKDLDRIRTDMRYYESRRQWLAIATLISDEKARDERIGKLLDELAKVRPSVVPEPLVPTQ